MKPSKKVFLVWAVAAVTLVSFGATGAWAGANEATDLASIYAHVPAATFTTVFYMSNTTDATINVNVKCYNDGAIRVGPVPGTNVNLAAFDVDIHDAVSLGLTADINFTGLGWCYFTTNSGSADIAITVVMGLQGGSPVPGGLPNLLASNSSAGIGASSAQAQVTDDDANAPMWLGQNWASFLFIVGPRATSSGNLTVNVYNNVATLVGTQTVSLAGRDMDLFTLPNFVNPAAVHGNVDVTRETVNANGGYMGWMYIINKVSLEGILYDLPQDVDDVHSLGPADRP